MSGFSNLTILEMVVWKFKNPRFCFVGIHLYSKRLSTIAMISSLIVLELFPASSFSNSSSLSQSSLGFSGKDTVEIPEARIAGELSNLMRDIYLLLLSPEAFSSKNISFVKQMLFF